MNKIEKTISNIQNIMYFCEKETIEYINKIKNTLSEHSDISAMLIKYCGHVEDSIFYKTKDKHEYELRYKFGGEILFMMYDTDNKELVRIRLDNTGKMFQYTPIKHTSKNMFTHRNTMKIFSENLMNVLNNMIIEIYNKVNEFDKEKIK